MSRVDRFAWERTVRCRRCLPKIPRPKRLFLVYFGTFMDGKTGVAHPGQALLADDLDMSERQIGRYLGTAEGEGLLLLLQRGHRRGDGTVTASTYAAILPVPVCPGHRDEVNRTSRCRVEQSSIGHLDVGLSEPLPDIQMSDGDGLYPTSGESLPDILGVSTRHLDVRLTREQELQEQPPPTDHLSLTRADARVSTTREKDQDLAWVVADAVEEHTGKRITLDHAQKIVTKLLDGRVRIGDPAAYIRKSVANDPVGWLRFGETGHEVLARLMGIAQAPQRSPQEPAQTAEPPPARPDTPDTPRVAPEAVSGLTPDGGPVGALGSAQRAELLRKIRRGTVLKTPKPAVPRIQRTSPDQPDLVPDTGIDELEQARKRQAAASLAEFTRAYEAGEKPWEDKPARRETS